MARGLPSCGVRGLSCPLACGILVSWPGMEPTFPALEGGFWIIGPPGKSLIWLSLIPADHNTRRLRGQFLGRLNMPPGWRGPKGLRRQHRLPLSQVLSPSQRETGFFSSFSEFSICTILLQIGKAMSPVLGTCLANLLPQDDLGSLSFNGTHF